MRYRWSAQRREIHSVQCADQGGHRRGKLSFLHHRAQCRHRRSARSALDRTRAIVKPQKVQPAIVEFVDIAGLVAGASKGEGLGNKFLATIRETDGIVNMVRCFVNDNVVHVAAMWIRFRTSKPYRPNWRWPIWPRWKKRCNAKPSWPGPATRKQSSWWRCWK